SGSIAQPGVIGTPPVLDLSVSHTTRHPSSGSIIQLATGPTSAQREQVFKKIMGEWHLDFSRGQETVLIDANGNYFVTSEKRGREYSPKFKLVLLACNPELTKIEIGKDYPDGKRLQIEVLTLSDDRMTGVAKH